MKAYYPIMKLLVPLLFGIYAAKLSHFSGVSLDIVSILFLLIVLSLIIVFAFFGRNNFLLNPLVYLAFFLFGYSRYFAKYERIQPAYFANHQAEGYVGVVKDLKHAGKFLRANVDIQEALSDWGKHHSIGEMHVYVDTLELQTLTIGDKVLFAAEINEIVNSGNPGDFDAQSYWNNAGIYHQAFLSADQLVVMEKGTDPIPLFKTLNQKLNQLLAENLSGDALSVTKGVLLGDKSDIRIELKDAFSGAGAMHLLAVSGLHVGIFLVIISWFMTTFFHKLPKWSVLTILLILLWTYAGITGFSASVNRSVTMFSFVAFAMVYGKHYSSINGLLASGFILLVINPAFLFDIGFQLSYMAMLGIFLFSDHITRIFFTKVWLLKKVWSGTAVALAAQLGTFPITLYYFHQFPNYFLLTNIGLMVFSGVLLGVGLGLIVVGAVPWVAPVVAFVLSMIATGLILFIQWINDLPFSVTKGIQIEPYEVWLIYLIIGLLFWSLVMGRKRIFKTVLLFSFIGFLYQAINYHEKYFRIEVILLNTSSPTFFIRDGKRGALVVFSKREDIASKMEFQRKSLETYYGSQVEVVVVDFDEGNLEHNNIRINMDKSVLKIETHQVYGLITNNYYASNQLEGCDQLIVGNWVSAANIEALKRNFGKVTLLKDGAISLR